MADARYAIRYRYTRQTRATIESRPADACYAFWYRYTRQTSATRESKLTDARHHIAINIFGYNYIGICACAYA